MPEPIVRYADYRKAYTRNMRVFRPVGLIEGPVFRPPMGTFAAKLLTDDGKRILSGIKKFVRKAPSWRGVSKVGVYFKWSGDEWATELQVAADWVREQGYEVEFEKSVMAREKGTDYEWFINTYKLVIKHPEE